MTGAPQRRGDRQHPHGPARPARRWARSARCPRPRRSTPSSARACASSPCAAPRSRWSSCACGSRSPTPADATDSAHAAVAEVLATTILSGTASPQPRRRSTTTSPASAARSGSRVDPERLSVSGHALADGLDTLLDVLADLVLAATHPDDELARERERLVERIELASAQPSVIARRALQERRYGDAPGHARDAAARGGHRRDRRRRARAAGLGAAARAARCSCSSATSTRPTPSRASEKALAGWSARAGRRAAGAAGADRARDLLLVDRPGAVQSQLRLSAPAVGRTDPRYPGAAAGEPGARRLLLVAPGGEPARGQGLHLPRVVEPRARSARRGAGGGDRRRVRGHRARRCSRRATSWAGSRWCRRPTTRSSRRGATSSGSLLISMTTQAGYASTVAALAAHGLSSAWVREHPARLEAVTIDEVAAAAAEFFAPTRFTGVVVADAARTRSRAARPRRSGDSVTSGTAGPDLRAAFHLDEDPSLSRSTVDRREQLRVDPDAQPRAVARRPRGARRPARPDAGRAGRGRHARRCSRRRPAPSATRRPTARCCSARRTGRRTGPSACPTRPRRTPTTRARGS